MELKRIPISIDDSINEIGQVWVFVYNNKDLREKLKAFVESPVDAMA